MDRSFLKTKIQSLASFGSLFLAFCFVCGILRTEVRMNADEAYEQIKKRRRAQLADEKIREKVLALAPCTKSDVLRAFPNRGTADQIHDVLNSMVLAGEVVVTRKATGGRPAEVITKANDAD